MVCAIDVKYTERRLNDTVFYSGRYRLQILLALRTNGVFDVFASSRKEVNPSLLQNQNYGAIRKIVQSVTFGRQD